MKGEEEKILKEILEDQRRQQAPMRRLGGQHDPSPAPLTPSEIPTIIATAPSGITPHGLNPVPEATLMSGPHFAGPPRFSPIPPDATFPPSPTMFPYTEEVYHQEPFPRLEEPVSIDINIPSPNPLNIPQKSVPNTPAVTPIPSPMIVDGEHRLTEADAEVLDVWFFREQLPETASEVTGEKNDTLIKWEFLPPGSQPKERGPPSPAVPS